MINIQELIASHVMVTVENVEVGMKVLFNQDGGEFNFKEGTVTSVDHRGKKAFVTINSDIKFVLKRKSYYESNPLSISKGSIPYIEGEHSDVYLP